MVHSLMDTSCHKRWFQSRVDKGLPLIRSPRGNRRPWKAQQPHFKVRVPQGGRVRHPSLFSGFNFRQSEPTWLEIGPLRRVILNRGDSTGGRPIPVGIKGWIRIHCSSLSSWRLIQVLRSMRTFEKPRFGNLLKSVILFPMKIDPIEGLIKDSKSS